MFGSKCDHVARILDRNKENSHKTACPFNESLVLQIPRCAPCPAGYSCGNITQPPVPCSAGYYSLQGDASCTECEAGQACTDPAQSPKHCPSGTYSQKVCLCHCRCKLLFLPSGDFPVCGFLFWTSLVNCVFTCLSTSNLISPCIVKCMVLVLCPDYILLENWPLYCHFVTCYFGNTNIAWTKCAELTCNRHILLWCDKEILIRARFSPRGIDESQWPTDVLLGKLYTLALRFYICKNTHDSYWNTSNNHSNRVRHPANIVLLVTAVLLQAPP